MGLVGRLEDLPLSDIIQIVFLSRRTGFLQISEDQEKYFIYFKNGMLVDIRKQGYPGMIDRIFQEIPDNLKQQVENLADSLPEMGKLDILLELNAISPQDLARRIFRYIKEMMDECMQLGEGEFLFELQSQLSPPVLGYTPSLFFKQGGIPPQKILIEGDELTVIQEIRDTLVKGKRLVKEAHTPSPMPLETQVIHPLEKVSKTMELTPMTSLIPLDHDIRHQPKKGKPTILGRFLISSKDSDGLEAGGINCLLLEMDPMMRVALKRLLSRGGFQIYHYNGLAPFLAKAKNLQHDALPFIVLIGCSKSLKDHDMETLFQKLHQMEPDLPIVVLSPSSDLSRHHFYYRLGADIVLVKPDLPNFSSQEVEPTLKLFSEEVAFAITRLVKRIPEFSQKAEFHDIATKERLNRSLSLLKKLILEVANPEDSSQVGLMVLRMAAEYLERAVLLLIWEGQVIGVGGFGMTGDNVPMNIRVRSIAIPLGENSIFSEVYKNRRPHKGKLKRTRWNEVFIHQLGQVFPSEVGVFPILAGENIPALLYGDNAEYRKPIGNTDGLEIFLSQAGFAFQRVLNKQSKKKVPHGV